MAETPAQARLYVLLARAARRAVIFRRGPSKFVLMIAWDTQRDTFEQGQWLRGRLYERRCDLCPSGQLLVYFAAKYKRYIGQLTRQLASGEARAAGAFPSWSAVSRVPYFTALALWPHDSAWSGGGLFADEHTLLLNHGSRVPPCHPSTSMPPPATLTVSPLGGPHGEDDTVQHPRLIRDGWTLAHPGHVIEQFGHDPSFVFDPPRSYTRPQRVDARLPVLLERQVRGLNKKNGPWYMEAFAVLRQGRERVVLDGAEWADWDHNGDLLFAREARLFRLGAGDLGHGPERALQLADFRDRTFTHSVPPTSATHW